VVTADVWYKVGTCVGYENDPGSWTLLDTGMGTSVGTDSPTYIALPGASGVVFDAGQTYGMYVDLGSNCRYTNGGPNTYSNTDLAITTNGGHGPSFTYLFYPRQWNGTFYYILDPDLVELVSFMAAGQRKTAIIKWETASEIDNAGFHIWRSKRQDLGENHFIRITDQLIPAKGSPTQGASYLHIDKGIVPGRTYWYRLEDIGYNGRSTFHDPVRMIWWTPAQGGY